MTRDHGILIGKGQIAHRLRIADLALFLFHLGQNLRADRILGTVCHFLGVFDKVEQFGSEIMVMDRPSRRFCTA